MKTITAACLLLFAAAAFAQTTPPPGPTLTGIALTSFVGFTPLPLDQGKTAQTSPCASSPYTTDSKIYTVILKVQPQISGATASSTPNVWIDATNPKKVYFVTGSPGVTQIKTSRRTYEAAFSNAAAEVVVPDLTWADASDILTELQKSPSAVTGLTTTISSSASLSLIPVTLPDNGSLNGLLQALADRGARLHTQAGWASAIQLVQASPPVVAGATAGTAIPLTIPATAGAVTTNFAQAPRDLQGLVNALGVRSATAKSGDASATASAPDPTIIFLVDSPCLTVALLPAVTGSNVTGGVVDFNGHYLFPFAQGHSFAKVGVGGTSPLNRSATGATSNLTASLDAAVNHDMNATGMSGPIRFAGGLTASYQRADTTGSAHTTKGSGGLKGSVSFPGVGLTGDDTRPTLTFQGVGSTMNNSGSPNTTQFEGNAAFKAKFRWTPILNSAIDAAYNISHDAIYGGRKTNYQINIDVIKFIVREPLEFAATWTCGRPAPDYKKVCGFYTGFSLTSNQ